MSGGSVSMGGGAVHRGQRGGGRGGEVLLSQLEEAFAGLCKQARVVPAQQGGQEGGGWDVSLWLRPLGASADSRHLPMPMPLPRSRRFCCLLTLTPLYWLYSLPRPPLQVGLAPYQLPEFCWACSGLEDRGLIGLQGGPVREPMRRRVTLRVRRAPLPLPLLLLLCVCVRVRYALEVLWWWCRQHVCVVWRHVRR